MDKKLRNGIDELEMKYAYIQNEDAELYLKDFIKMMFETYGVAKVVCDNIRENEYYLNALIYESKIGKYGGEVGHTCGYNTLTKERKTINEISLGNIIDMLGSLRHGRFKAYDKDGNQLDLH